ncbi:MAG: ATP-dependent Clp protease adaptor ClpS [Crocinitomicaceae bacterium]|nr:ATP-dependent Clp protease adaptor ClpS [Crocinitomicaceae bacterium]
MGQTQVQEEVALDRIVDQGFKIIVYNDDFNTFDHVIDTLIDLCSHSNIQAEQCAWIIHNNGKCDVKRGSYEKLEPICTGLLDRGLTAEIE